uniref:reticulon-4 receptor-like 2 n=1 Tax=Pristiophorus japonicus TaxID=55135 RepID=UPI00398E6735
MPPLPPPLRASLLSPLPPPLLPPLLAPPPAPLPSPLRAPLPSPLPSSLLPPLPALPLLLLLLLGLPPAGAPCPALCTCYRSPLTISCQSQGFTRLPGPLPGDGARLFLQNNLITELPPESFPPGVSTLWLYSNNLSSIRPGALANLSLLKELDLGHNVNLRSLEAGTFSGLVRLQSLHLHRCGLTSLPNAIFRRLYALQYLYLQDNGLLYLQGDLFLDLANLSHLFLHGNRLRALGANSFRGLRALDRLLLHHNRIGLVHPWAFRDLPRLATLFLFNNSLAELPAAALAGLPSLRFLRLNANPWACGCRARPLRRWFSLFEGASSPLLCATPAGREGRDLRQLGEEDFRGCPGNNGGQARPGPKPDRSSSSSSSSSSASSPSSSSSDDGDDGVGLSPKDQGGLRNISSLSDSPRQQQEGPEADYWPDYYYDDGGLASSDPRACAGRRCWSNAATTPSASPTAFWIVPFPLWGLIVLRWM